MRGEREREREREKQAENPPAIQTAEACHSKIES